VAFTSWDPGKNFSADCRAPAWDRIKKCRLRRFQLMLLLRFGRNISFQNMVVFFLLHPKVLPDFKISRFLSLKLTNYSKIDLQIPEWKPRFLAHDIMSFTPPNLGFLWPSYRPRGFRGNPRHRAMEYLEQAPERWPNGGLNGAPKWWGVGKPVDSGGLQMMGPFFGYMLDFWGVAVTTYFLLGVIGCYW